MGSNNWEILSFISSDKIIIGWDSLMKMGIEEMNEILATTEIHSVKRLSDGMVFSLDDELGVIGCRRLANETPLVITKLWQSFDQMRIDCGSLGLHIDSPVEVLKNNENIQTNQTISTFS